MAVYFFRDLAFRGGAEVSEQRGREMHASSSASEIFMGQKEAFTWEFHTDFSRSLGKSYS